MLLIGAPGIGSFGQLAKVATLRSCGDEVLGCCPWPSGQTAAAVLKRFLCIQSNEKYVVILQEPVATMDHVRSSVMRSQRSARSNISVMPSTAFLQQAYADFRNPLCAPSPSPPGEPNFFVELFRLCCCLIDVTLYFIDVLVLPFAFSRSCTARATTSPRP